MAASANAPVVPENGAWGWVPVTTTVPITERSWVISGGQCDHCYCRLAPDKRGHRACCKCGDTRARRFVGADGRATA